MLAFLLDCLRFGKLHQTEGRLSNNASNPGGKQASCVADLKQTFT